MPTIDPHAVRPYGDTLDDGAMQVSFTLPVTAGAAAKETARQLLAKLGFGGISITHMNDLGEGFTFFVAYVHTTVSIDAASIQVPEAKGLTLTSHEIDKLVMTRLGRPIVVVGACTGTDAHTVGLDAIMNMKGYAGDHGLESYDCFTNHNLGSQVPNDRLVAEARAVHADVILVSQVVTQKDVHVGNLTALADLLEAEGMRGQVLLICGGPRISHQLALELGYDAGFGAGTMPRDVAGFIAQEILRRHNA
jgi:beta-lysine 5,6-aminomutase beta subunit